MDELPEGWSSCSPLEVADLIRGVSYAKGEAATTASPGLVPLLRASNIAGGRLNFEGLQFVPERRVSVEQRLQVGDVVIAMSSGSQAVVGKAASAESPWPGTFGAFCGVLRPRREIDHRYFGLFFQTDTYRKGISSLAAGTNINNIKRQYFEEFSLPVPPLPEQKRIVEKVEALLAQVQAARDRLERVQQILKRFRQAVLAAACEGRLTATDPEELSEATLGEVVEVLDSRRIPVNSNERASRAGTVPYYGATGQVGWIDDYLFNEELLLLGEDGAPFLDKSKPIAYLIRGKSWVNNHAHVLRARAGRTTNAYLKLVLDRTDFEQFVSGSTRLKLTQEAMRRIPVPLPTLGTQARIVSEVTSLLALAETVETRARRALVAGGRAPQAILAKAFAGELVPTESELARVEGRGYESGEELLARVRAGTAAGAARPGSRGGVARKPRARRRS